MSRSLNKETVAFVSRCNGGSDRQESGKCPFRSDPAEAAGDLAEVELLRSQLAALQFEDTVREAELKEQDALMGLQVLLGRREQTAMQMPQTVASRPLAWERARAVLRQAKAS